ncbi:MAG: curli-like amyloid fiber formation chaperone CsgH [Paracoccaceae bacterium]
MTRPFLRSALALALPLALSALALGGTPGPLAAGNDDRPLRCEISARPSPLGITLEARASSGARAEGTYSLDVAQLGAAGRTVIRQGGDFSLRAGETGVLGRVMLGHDPSDYAARMVLRAGGAEVTCRAPGANDI